jgi:hypothetical protein
MASSQLEFEYHHCSLRPWFRSSPPIGSGAGRETSPRRRRKPPWACINGTENGGAMSGIGNPRGLAARQPRLKGRRHEPEETENYDRGTTWLILFLRVQHDSSFFCGHNMTHPTTANSPWNRSDGRLVILSRINVVLPTVSPISKYKISN